MPFPAPIATRPRRPASIRRSALPLLLFLPFAVGTASRDATSVQGGKKGDIAFGTRRDGGPPEIWRMKQDGSGAEKITESSGDIVNGLPSWAPDGRRIAFVSTRAGNREIFVMKEDGTEVEQLTTHEANDEAPDWSHDGKSIVFHSQRDGNFELYRLDVGSKAVTRLTTHPGTDQYPDWSPDGRMIAFQRDSNIHVLDVRSGEVRRLQADAEIDDMPSWSRDGRRIAFMSRRDGYPAIYVMNADGSGPVNVTPKPAEVPANQWNSMWPSWSRDGKSIYFQGIRPESQPDVEIFVVRADGSETRRLTNAPGIDSRPVER